jgi:hypothetical protein
MASGTPQAMDLPPNSEGIRYVPFHPTKPIFVFASKVRDESLLEMFITSTVGFYKAL